MAIPEGTERKGKGRETGQSSGQSEKREEIKCFLLVPVVLLWQDWVLLV